MLIFRYLGLVNSLQELDAGKAIRAFPGKALLTRVSLPGEDTFAQVLQYIQYPLQGFIA